MSDQRGPFARTAPYLAVSCWAVGFSFWEGWQRPSTLMSIYVCSTSLLALGAAVISSYKRGVADTIQEAINAYDDATAAVNTMGAAVQAQLGPIHLTGGGPLDGTTMPVPTLTQGHHRLVLHDPETDELLGAYVQDDDDPNRLIWEEGAE